MKAIVGWVEDTKKSNFIQIIDGSGPCRAPLLCPIPDDDDSVLRSQQCKLR